MLRPIPSLHRLLALPLFMLLLPGCAGVGMGTLEDILASGIYGGDLTGEIRQIDFRRQEIEVRSGWSGAERVRYDGRTRVVYRDRRYDVRSLERGDHVRIRVDTDRRGERWASYIEVEQIVRDRRGRDRVERASRLERIDGVVGRIDGRGGWFELRSRRGGAVQVVLPYDPSRAVRDRFRRLRRGQRVTVEGVVIDRSRLELYRFR